MKVGEKGCKDARGRGSFQKCILINRFLYVRNVYFKPFKTVPSVRKQKEEKQQIIQLVIGYCYHRFTSMKCWNLRTRSGVSIGARYVGLARDNSNST